MVDTIIPVGLCRVYIVDIIGIVDSDEYTKAMDPEDMDNAQLKAYYQKQLEKAEKDKEAALKEQAEKAERDKEAALKEQAEKAEKAIIDIRYSIFLEEREGICKYSSKTCRSNNIYFRLPPQEH